MVKEVNLDDMKEKTVGAFTGGYMCSETVVYILNKYYDLGISQDAIAMSTGFPFGFGDGGNVCGAVAGATMCLGKVFGRTVPGDPKFKKCCSLVRELNEDVIDEYGTTICPELIEDYDFKEPDRKQHCIGIVLTVVVSFAHIMERECGVTILRNEA